MTTHTGQTLKALSWPRSVWHTCIRASVTSHWRTTPSGCRPFAPSAGSRIIQLRAYSASLQEALDQPAADRMENLLLIAESGMGKTMLLRKFQRDHGRAFDAAIGMQPHPIVLTLMAEDPSEEAFFFQVLKAVGAPLDMSRRRHRMNLRETTFRLLRELGTRMLMIDEINSVLIGSARQQRQFLQLLRFLSNELQVTIVCAGVPEARFALLSDPQLRSRVADVALEPGQPGRAPGLRQPAGPRSAAAAAFSGGQREAAAPADRAVRWHHPVDLPRYGARGRDGDT